MPVLKQRRSRQVAFRISDDEYERLIHTCASVGARSISDFARVAVCQWIGPAGPSGTDPLSERIRSLDVRMRDLDRRLHQLTVLIKTPASCGASDP